MRSYRVLFWVLVLLVLLLTLALSSPLWAQDETLSDSSTLPEPLWSSLLQLTSSLPSQIDAFRTSLEGQVESLSATVRRLQISNGSLIASNVILMQQNADLQTSLQLSQADLATSEQARKRSEKALQDSTASITLARSDAEKVTRELALWKWGAIGAGAVAVVAWIVAAVK